MTKYKGYKVRLFPREEQEEMLWKHIGACRFIWNFFLEEQNLRYEMRKRGKELYGDKYKPSECEKFLTNYDMSKILTVLKKQKEYFWLNEISSHSLQKVCADLYKAYKLMFNKTHGKPSFKSKKTNDISFPIRHDKNATYFIDGKYINIPKIGKIKCKVSYKNISLTQKLYNPIISYTKSSDKWMLSFSLEVDENQVRKSKLTDASMGIDLGIKELAVVAFGDKQLVFHNINKSKRMRTLERKKKHLQRAVARKYTTNGSYKTGDWSKSKAIEKYEQMIREIEYKQANIRKNYIHHITRQLVNMMPARVVMEDLDVSGMRKNKYLSEKIQKQCFYTFGEIIKYKCEELGIEFALADRYFPSSKVCSCCGHKKKNLKLKDRTYICPVCGLAIDRDYNAAINLMNYSEN